MPPKFSAPRGPWIVYNANGGENGVGDRVYGPYRFATVACKVAAYINEFPQELGRAWVLPLRPASEAP